MKKILQIATFLPIFISTVSFASTATFYILNSSDSIQNTITITKSSLVYEDWWCSGSMDGIADGLQVRKRQEGAVTIQYSDFPSNCTAHGDDSVNIYLRIDTVDNKGASSVCKSKTYSFSPTENGDETIRITEMTDRFICEPLVGRFTR